MRALRSDARRRLEGVAPMSKAGAPTMRAADGAPGGGAAPDRKGASRRPRKPPGAHRKSGKPDLRTKHADLG
jgi:hypothetical protein